MANGATIGLCGRPIQRVRFQNPLRNMSSVEGTLLALSELFKSLLAAPWGRDAPQMATELLRYLSNELPASLREHQVDLAAAIASAGDPGEWLDCLARLERQRGHLAKLSAGVEEGLNEIALGAQPQEPLRFVVAAFALIEALRSDPLSAERGNVAVA